MLADLVASYTIRLNEGTKREELDTEIRETLEMMKGIQRWNALELQDGAIAFDLHLHGQTDREVAEKVGERVLKLFQHFDLATIDYHGIEFPDDVQLAKEKWQGRESIDEIIKEIDGTNYIRLDYYTRGLSFDDLGITDANTEMLYVQSLQKWPQRTIGREAIRRVRDHFERLEELQAMASPKPRGRTGRTAPSLLRRVEQETDEEPSSVTA